LNRLVQFGLAKPAPSGAGLDLYRHVAPLSTRQVARVPQWTRDTHERLFGAHLEEIDELAQHQASVASITARLDQIQIGTGRPATRAAAHGQAIE
ncbi:MAG TPA: hypothetical protein PKA98_16930, partial [Acidimicrobiales bacterium]|nr:hypothetical protein [Acidimicrobiales bacterium]